VAQAEACGYQKSPYDCDLVFRQGQMINLHEFRAAQYSVPFSCGDELPECCFACVYLLSDATDACLCDSGFYFCGYSWPDKLTQTVPPCLLDPC
jgi:hypothetical protein